MKNLLVVCSLMFAAGCGADVETSCDNYFDAALACMDEAYAGDDASLQATKDAFAGTCDVYGDMSGSAAKDAADLLDCYTETLEGADCSTPEAYLTSFTSIGDCAL